MRLFSEFKAFALKGNVIDLAVAVVMGGAFGKIVNAIVTDLIMPVLLPLQGKGGGWREWKVTALELKVGDLLGAVIDFVSISAVLFLIVVKLGTLLRKKAEEPADTPTKQCPECLESIPLAARRCRACTAVVT